MPLTHEFMVSIQTQYLAQKSLTALPSSDCVSIHDDIIRYIYDSLRWVASCNYGNANQRQYGLCLYGQTVFYPDQITHFKQVMQAWYQLFTNAPSTITLTGDWTWQDDAADSGDYETLSLQKDWILADFSKLITLCECVERDHQLCLVHHGI